MGWSAHPSWGGGHPNRHPNRPPHPPPQSAPQIRRSRPKLGCRDWGGAGVSGGVGWHPTRYPNVGCPMRGDWGADWGDAPTPSTARELGYEHRASSSGWGAGWGVDWGVEERRRLGWCDTPFQRSRRATSPALGGQSALPAGTPEPGGLGPRLTPKGGAIRATAPPGDRIQGRPDFHSPSKSGLLDFRPDFDLDKKGPYAYARARHA